MRHSDRVDDEAEGIGDGSGGDEGSLLVHVRWDGRENLIRKAGDVHILRRDDLKAGHTLRQLLVEYLLQLDRHELSIS